MTFSIIHEAQIVDTARASEQRVLREIVEQSMRAGELP